MEDISYLIGKLFSVWPVVGFHGGTQLFQQATLFPCEAGGGYNIHVNVQIPSASTVDVWDSLPANTEAAAGLGAFRDVQTLLAFHRRHLDLRAQGGLGKADGDPAKQIMILAFEERMLLDVQNDIEVAGMASLLLGP